MADPVLVMTRLGGVATGQRCDGLLLAGHPAAVEDGAVVRVEQGRYALPSIEPARSAASRLTGTSSHTSAALFHGWPVAYVPEQPHVTVSPRRNLPAHRRVDVIVHWRSLDASDIHDDWVTTPVRTVIDCCLDLPFAEALAVFDSSWRAGLKPKEVQLAARCLPSRQRDRVWRVAAAADARAANPFESVLRAIAMDVSGLSVDTAAGHRRRWLLRPRRPGRRLSRHRHRGGQLRVPQLGEGSRPGPTPIQRPDGAGLAGAALHLEAGHVRAGVG